MNQAMLDFGTEAREEDLVVLGDKHLIPRLLSILLENASKYTPPGGVGKVARSSGGYACRSFRRRHWYRNCP